MIFHIHKVLRFATSKKISDLIHSQVFGWWGAQHFKFEDAQQTHKQTLNWQRYILNLTMVVHHLLCTHLGGASQECSWPGHFQQPSLHNATNGTLGFSTPAPGTVVDDVPIGESSQWRNIGSPWVWSICQLDSHLQVGLHYPHSLWVPGAKFSKWGKRDQLCGEQDEGSKWLLKA